MHKMIIQRHYVFMSHDLYRKDRTEHQFLSENKIMFDNIAHIV